MIYVLRAVNGISINGKEFLLDDKGQPLEFNDTRQAKDFLRDNGVDLTDDEMEDSFHFEDKELHKIPVKNIIFVFTVQDGDSQRTEYQTEEVDAKLTDEEIDARGDELNRMNFPSEELSKGFFWDSSWETAGCYSRFVELPDTESFKIIQGII